MSLPIEEWRHLPALAEATEASWLSDRPAVVVVCTRVRDHLPALLDELAELRNLATFVATKLRLEEEASSDGLPCKAMSARDEALSALAKHAGPWSPECAALSTYTMLDQACRENTEMLDELADLRAYRERTEAALAELSAFYAGRFETNRLAVQGDMSRLGLWREPKAGEGGVA